MQNVARQAATKATRPLTEQLKTCRQQAVTAIAIIIATIFMAISVLPSVALAGG